MSSWIHAKKSCNYGNKVCKCKCYSFSLSLSLCLCVSLSVSLCLPVSHSLSLSLSPSLSLPLSIVLTIRLSETELCTSILTLKTKCKFQMWGLLRRHFSLELLVHNCLYEWENCHLTLLRMGLFRTAQGWVGAKRPPP